MITLEKPGTPEDILDYLEHHGVQGMKWGVRRAYTERVGKTADAFRRVGKGEGKLLETYQVHKDINNVEAIFRGGHKKAALARADIYQGHADRLANGKATLNDKLTMYGNVHIGDIVKGAKYARQERANAAAVPA